MRHQPSTFLAALLFMVGWLLVSCSPGSNTVTAPEKEVVPIILIAGQSNSRGVGKVADLSLSDQKLVEDLATGAIPSHLWNHSTQRFENVKAGINTAVKNGALLNFTPELFGVEVGLAVQTSAMNFWDQAHIIKWGKGGATLDQRYLGSHGNWSPEFSGPTAHYPFFIDQIDKALETIESSGKVGVIQLLIWIQGESDSRWDLGNNEGSYGEAYVGNLRNFINALYSPGTFKSPQPNFSILIARIHKGLEQFANCERYARYPGCTPFQSVDTVALVQETIEKEFPSVSIFDLTDLLFPELDSVKLNTWIEDGQLTPGETYYGDIHYVSEDLWDAMPARIAKELVELPTFEEVPKGR
jgi:hypothetical protein